MWVLTIRPRFQSSHNVSTRFSPALSEWRIARIVKTACSENLMRRDSLGDTEIGSGKILIVHKKNVILGENSYGLRLQRLSILGGGGGARTSPVL
jgi:hypothetical protein